jgi:predicted DNA-binding protein
MERLEILKKSAKRAANYIRQICRDAIACTTEHKLAVCLSVIRAVNDGDYSKVSALQSKCKELKHYNIVQGFDRTENFQKIKDLAVELMHLDVKERAEELRQQRANLPEETVEAKIKSIADQLRRMRPAGCSDISALTDGKGGFIRDPAAIAKNLNEYWQDTFD